MARYSIAGRSTVAGTAARAIASLFSVAATNAKLVEVQLYNTTNTACVVTLIRFSAATNVGAGLTEANHDVFTPAPQCTGFAGHTGDGTTTGGALYQATLGAAAGSGVIWTFGDRGVNINVGTANGIGITCGTGTGQILDYVIVWDE